MASSPKPGFKGPFLHHTSYRMQFAFEGLVILFTYKCHFTFNHQAHWSKKNQNKVAPVSLPSIATQSLATSRNPNPNFSPELTSMNRSL